MVSPRYICGQSIYYFELSIRFHIGFGVWIILVEIPQFGHNRSEDTEQCFFCGTVYYVLEKDSNT